MNKYKRIMKLKLAGKDKVNFLRSLTRRMIDDNHAIIELPGIPDKGMICNKNGLIADYSKMQDGPLNRYIGDITINDEHFYLYRVVKTNNTSKYRWCYFGWTNMFIAEHVIISIAFGLWDNIKNIDNMDVCHKVAVTKDKCNNSVNNLFIASHKFNMICAHLESAIRCAGYTGEIPLDKDTFEYWCDVLETLVYAEDLAWNIRG